MGNGNLSENLAKLRAAINHSFDLEGLRALAFDLGTPFEELRGEVKSSKVLALLEYQEQRGRTSDLLKQLKRHRPNEDWSSYLPTGTEARSPYKGLQYFTEEDEPLFFGREKVTEQLLKRLTNERFLVVVGASGSGKSSVVRAGVIPAIRRGKIEENGLTSANWPIHVITPTDQPLKNLAVSLTRDKERIKAATYLAADLLEDSASLDLFLMREAGENPTNKLLLIVDQFEELFTLCDNKKHRHQFVDNLVTAVKSGSKGRLKLILIMRADFYAYAVQYTSLQPLLETGQHIISAMGREELGFAILKPAVREGWRFQNGLIEQILDDVGNEPGALPLLSHALQETWCRREGQMMTLAGYQKAGGVRGAIASTANAFYDGLETDEQKQMAKRIFLRLAELGEGTEDTRRRVWKTDLSLRSEENDTVTLLLQRLVDARLITTDSIPETDNTIQNTISGQNIDTTLIGEFHETKNIEVVEVAHEALIREWPALRSWLDENRDWLRLRRRLNQDTKDWLASGRKMDRLYQGSKLEQAQIQAKGREDDLNIFERGFLAASDQVQKRRLEKLEEQRQQKLDAAQELAEAKQRESEAKQKQLEEQQNRIKEVRRRSNILKVVLLAVVGITIVAVIQTFRASNREQEAEFLARFSKSQSYAYISQSVFDQYPERALLLAIESGKTYETTFALKVLNQLIPKLAEPQITLFHEDQVNGAIWAGHAIPILSWSNDKTIRIWQNLNQENVTILNHDGIVNGAAWNKDHNQILSWSVDGKVRIWESFNSNIPPMILEHNSPVNGALWSSDESKVLSWAMDGSLHIWNAKSGQELINLKVGSATGPITGAKWNSDGTLILGWGEDGIAKVWKVNSDLEYLYEFKHDGPINGAIWNEDETLILSWSEDGTIRVWDVENTNEQLVTITHDGPVNGAIWNTSETHILSWSNDKTVKVWDVADPFNPLLLFLHKEEVLGAIWDDTEQKILTWSKNGNTAQIWDSRTEELVLELSANENDFVTFANWNWNQGQLMLGSSSGAINVYEISTEFFASQACVRAMRNFSAGEWQLYFPNQDYRRTCDNLPLHPSIQDEMHKLMRGQ